MKRIFLLSLLGLLSCDSDDKVVCNEKTSDEISGIVIRVLDEKYRAYNNSDGDLSRFGAKVTSQNTYENLFNTCCAGKLDSIDFDKYDLLGLTTVNLGLNSTYLRDVVRDDANKKIIYTITERYCEKASPFDGQSNFVLVPKIPSDYQIEYKRNQ